MSLSSFQSFLKEWLPGFKSKKILSHPFTSFTRATENADKNKKRLNRKEREGRKVFLAADYTDYHRLKTCLLSFTIPF